MLTIGPATAAASAPRQRVLKPLLYRLSRCCKYALRHTRPDLSPELATLAGSPGPSRFAPVGSARSPIHARPRYGFPDAPTRELTGQRAGGGPWRAPPPDPVRAAFPGAARHACGAGGPVHGRRGSTNWLPGDTLCAGMPTGFAVSSMTPPSRVRRARGLS